MAWAEFGGFAPAPDRGGAEPRGERSCMLRQNLRPAAVSVEESGAVPLSGKQL